MIWHLLKSGCKVGKNPMIQEYDKAFNFLNKEFPDFNKNKYINLFTKTRDKKLLSAHYGVLDFYINCIYLNYSLYFMERWILVTYGQMLKKRFYSFYYSRICNDFFEFCSSSITC